MSVRDNCPLCGSPRFSEKRPFSADSPYTARRCAGCGSSRVHPIPDEATLAAFYANYGHSEVSWEEFLTLVEYGGVMARRIMKTSGVARPRFLDIGGASGFLSVAMARLGADASTQDVSGNAARWVERANAHFGTDVHVVRESVDRLAASGARFDAVNCSQVLEHVPDPPAFVGLVKALLLPGGILFLDTPHDAGWMWVFKEVIRPFINRPDYCRTLKPPEHLWGYTRRGMRFLLDRAGFDVVTLSDYGMGDPAFQPASRVWYLPLGVYFSAVNVSHLNFFNAGKQFVAAADRCVLTRWGVGGGLAAVARNRG